MIEPKPLTKEEREELSGFATQIRRNSDELSVSLYKVVSLLLAAEAYWREKVKAVQEFPCRGEYFGDLCCAFCNCDDFMPHKPDCAWKLANE